MSELFTHGWDVTLTVLRDQEEKLITRTFANLADAYTFINSFLARVCTPAQAEHLRVVVENSQAPTVGFLHVHHANWRIHALARMKDQRT